MAESAAKPPPSPLWIGAAVLVVGALTSLGFVRGGANLGLLYGLGGLVVGVSLVSIERAVRVHKALNRTQPTAPDSLAPTQTLSILAAAADHGQGKAPSFASPVLQAVERLDKAAEADPVAALTEAKELTNKYPTSAALLAKRAQLELATDRLGSATVTAGRAIGLALNGGSAPVAVSLAEHFEAHANAVPLDPAVRTRLGVVLEARDRAALARAYFEGPEPASPGPDSPEPDSPPSA